MTTPRMAFETLNFLIKKKRKVGRSKNMKEKSIVVEDLLTIFHSLDEPSPEKLREYIDSQIRQLEDEILRHDNLDYFETVQEQLRTNPPLPKDFEQVIASKKAHLEQELEKTRLDLERVEESIASAEAECKQNYSEELMTDASNAIDLIRSLLAISGVTRQDLQQLGCVFRWLHSLMQSISELGDRGLLDVHTCLILKTVLCREWPKLCRWSLNLQSKLWNWQLKTKIGVSFRHWQSLPWELAGREMPRGRFWNFSISIPR